MSEHTFKPGDRAVLIYSITGNNFGRVVTVTSSLQPYIGTPHPCIPRGMPVHDIDGSSTLDPAAKQAVCPPSWLEPLPDDGAEKGEWTEELRKLCAGRVEA